MPESDAYETLAARHGFGGSERYRRILKFVMSPRQARLAEQLPIPLDELATKEGLPLETVEAELDELFKKGVVFPRNFYTRETYRFARDVMQLHDATESLWGIEGFYTEEQKRELWGLWWDFLQEEWDPRRMPQLAKTPAPPLRIVPAYKAIKDIDGVLPYENMHAMVDAASLISVVSCSCRKRKESLGEPCAHSHDMNCIQFNRAAQYVEGRGHGKMLSKDEVLRLIEETEDHGLVHQWPNADVMTTNTLCSCCDDCCVFFLPMREYGVPWTTVYAKSRFEARNDLDACDGCQDCIERCQFDALTMEKVGGYKKLKAIVDAEKCMGCGVCVLVCEPESLKMEIVRPPEHIPQLAHAGEGHSHA
jgi:Pyruvate/2-oxoacid:ferredoxin oxidoreductase delta subunit